MSNILWFSDCSYKKKKLVGGKCASLGELYNLSNKLDFNISDGFAITTKMYDDFLNNYNLHPIIESKLNEFNSINNSSIKDLNDVSNFLMNLIMKYDLLDNHKKRSVRYA